MRKFFVTLFFAQVISACQNSGTFRSQSDVERPAPKQADTVAVPTVAVTAVAGPTVAVSTPRAEPPAPVLTAMPTATALPTQVAGAACSTNGSVTFDVSVARHLDTEAGTTSAEWPIIADGLESNVLKLDLKSIRGDVLPVSEFALDDVAMIAKADTLLTDVVQYIAPAHLRTINVPVSALLISDGNNPNLAAGYLNANATTVYRFQGRPDVAIPGGGQFVPLSQVYNSGLPLIAHNAISINMLREKGYVVGSQLVFKVIHVAHGGGYVSLKVTLDSCR